MRYTTQATSLAAPVLARQSGGTVVYRGTTTNAVATELFIDGQAGRRLVPDARSGGIMRLTVAAFNTATSAVLASFHQVLFQVSAAGVITLVDQDSVTGGSQDNVLVAATTAGTRAGALGVTVGADNGIQVDVVAATATAPAYLRVQVRGVVAQTVNWEVVVDYVEATAANG